MAIPPDLAACSRLTLARGWPTSSIIQLIGYANYVELFFFTAKQYFILSSPHQKEIWFCERWMWYLKRSWCGGCCCLNQSWCWSELLSWLIAEMLDKKFKMEEAADTSSAGPLETSLFPDNQNWDDRALKDPEEPGSSGAYRCVFCDLGNMPIGVSWGEGWAGLVIVCPTVIGHWTQTMGGRKRIGFVHAPPAPLSAVQ